MTRGLTDEKAKWLTYLVYILLTLQSTVIGWMMVKQFEMPDKYVRLERYSRDQATIADRYRCDMGRIEKILETINAKLDRHMILPGRGGD